MKTIEAIYSPVCEASIAFIGRLRKWMENTGVNVLSAPYDAASIAQAELYHASGLLVHNRLMDSCFVDVFFEGKRIDSVPLNKSRIFRALGMTCDDMTDEEAPIEEAVTTQQAREAIFGNAISWIPITKETVQEELTMCLSNYPFGNPPARFHKQCIETKLKVFDEVWPRETCAGVYAKLDNKVIGLLEVMPREILKKYGFLTGSAGCDGAYLTVGCYEVGYGMPRKEIIDELMRHLEMIHGMFTRKMLEGIGVFEWPEGFTPYWVYDKYGFTRQANISENKVVMEKNYQTISNSSLLGSLGNFPEGSV